MSEMIFKSPQVKDNGMHPTQLSYEAAKDQVDLFLDYYDIEPEVDAESSDHRAQLLNAIHRLTKHVMKGRVEISMEGNKIKVIQKLKFPVNDVNSLEYKVCGGVARSEMKHADQNDMNGKIYNMVGSLTNWTGNSIKKLEGVDISAVECLGMLFLAV